MSGLNRPKNQETGQSSALEEDWHFDLGKIGNWRPKLVPSEWIGISQTVMNRAMNLDLPGKPRLNRLDIRYGRESRFQIGLPDLNRYHSLTGYFDQRLSSQISLHLLSRYYRTETSTYGDVETLGGGAGFDFALHQSLVASVFGHYVYQRSGSSISSQYLNSDRYMLIGGLTYIFPSARRERDAPVAGDAKALGGLGLTWPDSLSHHCPDR